MIDRKVIEDFIKLMVEHDLVELDVADGDQSITLRRAGAFAAPAAAAPMYAASQPMPMPAATGAVGTPSGGGHAAPSAPPATGGGDAAGTTVIKSPMVGTFYSRANPDAEPFVGAGSKVSESSVVCLIEAMKVFNEIKAECRGTIVEVLVHDGDAVEFGQPMFRVKTG